MKDDDTPKVDDDRLDSLLGPARAGWLGELSGIEPGQATHRAVVWTGDVASNAWDCSLTGHVPDGYGGCFYCTTKELEP